MKRYNNYHSNQHGAKNKGLTSYSSIDRNKLLKINRNEICHQPQKNWRNVSIRYNGRNSRAEGSTVRANTPATIKSGLRSVSPQSYISKNRPNKIYPQKDQNTPLRVRPSNHNHYNRLEPQRVSRDGYFSYKAPLGKSKRVGSSQRFKNPYQPLGFNSKIKTLRGDSGGAYYASQAGYNPFDRMSSGQLLSRRHTSTCAHSPYMMMRKAYNQPFEGPEEASLKLNRRMTLDMRRVAEIGDQSNTTRFFDNPTLLRFHPIDQFNSGTQLHRRRSQDFQNPPNQPNQIGKTSNSQKSKSPALHSRGSTLRGGKANQSSNYPEETNSHKTPQNLSNYLKNQLNSANVSKRRNNTVNKMVENNSSFMPSPTPSSLYRQKSATLNLKGRKKIKINKSRTAQKPLGRIGSSITVSRDKKKRRKNTSMSTPKPNKLTGKHLQMINARSNDCQTPFKLDSKTFGNLGRPFRDSDSRFMVKGLYFPMISPSDLLSLKYEACRPILSRILEFLDVGSLQALLRVCQGNSNYGQKRDLVKLFRQRKISSIIFQTVGRNQWLLFFREKLFLDVRVDKDIERFRFPRSEIRLSSNTSNIIKNDVARTYAEHPYFRIKDHKESLQKILEKAVKNLKGIKYFQGMSLISGLFLMLGLNPVETFYTFVYFLKNMNYMSLYDESFSKAMEVARQSKEMIASNFRVGCFFEMASAKLDMIILTWILTCFTSLLSLNEFQKFSVFLVEKGTEFLPCFAAAVIIESCKDVKNEDDVDNVLLGLQQPWDKLNPKSRFPKKVFILAWELLSKTKSEKFSSISKKSKMSMINTGRECSIFGETENRNEKNLKPSKKAQIFNTIIDDYDEPTSRSGVNKVLNLNKNINIRNNSSRPNFDNIDINRDRPSHPRQSISPEYALQLNKNPQKAKNKENKWFTKKRARKRRKEKFGFTGFGYNKNRSILGQNTNKKKNFFTREQAKQFQKSPIKGRNIGAEYRDKTLLNSFKRRKKPRIKSTMSQYTKSMTMKNLRFENKMKANQEENVSRVGKFFKGVSREIENYRNKEENLDASETGLTRTPKRHNPSRVIKCASKGLLSPKKSSKNRQNPDLAESHYLNFESETGQRKTVPEGAFAPQPGRWLTSHRESGKNRKTSSHQYLNFQGKNNLIPHKKQSNRTKRDTDRSLFTSDISIYRFMSNNLKSELRQSNFDTESLLNNAGPNTSRQGLPTTDRNLNQKKHQIDDFTEERSFQSVRSGFSSKAKPRLNKKENNSVLRVSVHNSRHLRSSHQVKVNPCSKPFKRASKDYQNNSTNFFKGSKNRLLSPKDANINQAPPEFGSNLGPQKGPMVTSYRPQTHHQRNLKHQEQRHESYDKRKFRCESIEVKKPNQLDDSSSRIMPPSESSEGLKFNPNRTLNKIGSSHLNRYQTRNGYLAGNLKRRDVCKENKIFFGNSSQVMRQGRNRMTPSFAEKQSSQMRVDHDSRRSRQISQFEYVSARHERQPLTSRREVSRGSSSGVREVLGRERNPHARRSRVVKPVNGAWGSKRRRGGSKKKFLFLNSQSRSNSRGLL